MTFSHWSARLVLAGLIVLGAAAAPRAAELSGVLYGIDDATGASIEIHPDPGGYTGTFYDAQGHSQKFKADRHGDSAEAVLDMDHRTVLMRVDPLPFGAEVSIVPVDKKGNLDLPAGRKLTFVRTGLNLPKPGPDFMPAPRDGRGRIAANGFLASYEFWDPTGVRNGYLSLAERFRTLMRLFPAVQLDVIWKLCLAPNADKALGMALRGQGVTCKQVIDGIAHTQTSGSFNDYKALVDAQKANLRMTVRCADGYPEKPGACDKASQALAKQAITLDTAGTVLARFR